MSSLSDKARELATLFMDFAEEFDKQESRMQAHESTLARLEGAADHNAAMIRNAAQTLLDNIY